MNNSTGIYTDTGNINIEDLPDDAIVCVRVADLKDRMEWLMFRLGQYGFPVFVRFDPFREDKNFTVMIGNYPREDTNKPTEYLLNALNEKEGRR